MNSFIIDGLLVITGMVCGIAIGYELRGKIIISVATNALSIATAVQTKMNSFESEVRNKLKI